MKRDDLHDGNESVDAMLELARDVPPPTDDDKSRVRSKLALRLGTAGLAAGAAARSGVASGAKSWLGGAAAKWLGVAAVSVGLGTGVVSLTRRGPTPATEPARRPPTAAATPTPQNGALRPSAPVPPSVAATPRAEPALPSDPAAPRFVAPRKPTRPMTNAVATSESPPTPAPETAPAALPEPPSLHAQLAVLRAVHAHLSSRHYDDALALLARERSTFENTPLAEEALALDVIARCASGASDAESARAAFVSAYPSSVHRARIGAACRDR